GFAELRPALAGLPPAEAELAATALALTSWHQIHGFCARCGAESAVIMGGWQRQCPACKALHFPRTDPVVIMLATRGNRVLMGRGAGWPEGFYSLLAGFMEPGETIEAAARREIMEEAGVLSGKARYLASQPWPFPASLMIGCHVEALSDDLCADPTEIEDLCWLTREELAEVFAGQHPSIRPPRQGAIASYLLGEWLADRLPTVG
ncbi:MAG: NAD(+) diphosphatase, partial [Paracoccaceae bacterium]